MLSLEEERQLFQRMMEGDTLAWDELVEKHQGFVKGIAGRLCNPKSNPELFEDLVQEGAAALIEAINRFNQDKGVRLDTYAYKRVKGAMLNYIAKEYGGGMNIPRPLRDLARKVGQARDKLMQELEREPTVEEIANAVGEPVEKVDEALNLLVAQGIVSLEELSEPTREGEGAWEPSSQEPLPDEVLIRKEEIYAKKEEIYAALRELPLRRKMVIELRFTHNHTLKEIGHIMKISENAVKQLLRNALNALREKCHLTDDELADYHGGVCDAPGRERIEAHLSHCLICQQRLKEITETLQDKNDGGDYDV